MILPLEATDPLPVVNTFSVGPFPAQSAGEGIKRECGHNTDGLSAGRHGSFGQGMLLEEDAVYRSPEVNIYPNPPK